MEGRELERIIEDVDVFYRASPKHKLTIVKVSKWFSVRVK